MVKNKAQQIIDVYGWERAMKKKLLTLGGKGYTVQAKPTKTGLRHLKKNIMYV